MSNLVLSRPLVFFDLETTGTDPASDRVVEVAAVRVEPDGSRQVRTRRINPERPIPPEATAVHGISDEDVREEPVFRQIARSLLQFLEGADLAGFNIRRFDVPLLDREFRDCGLDLELRSRKLVDALTIYHRKERRDLTAAVRFYLDRDHAGAHSGEDDALATLDVLEAQLERYPDLPRTVDELDAWGGPPGDRVDYSGKFVWDGDEAVFGFGKHQGKALREVAASQPDYLGWILGSDFPDDSKEIVRRATEGEFPERVGPSPETSSATRFQPNRA